MNCNHSVGKRREKITISLLRAVPILQHTALRLREVCEANECVTNLDKYQESSIEQRSRLWPVLFCLMIDVFQRHQNVIANADRPRENNRNLGSRMRAGAWTGLGRKVCTTQHAQRIFSTTLTAMRNTA